MRTVRNYLRALYALPIALACCAAGAAADYPSKPLRLIIPYPPGGGNDFVARAISSRLAERLGQPVVVDNRGGAHGIIATDLTAKSPPDGHTLLLGGSGHAINPLIYAKLPYDTDRDFAPVTLAAIAPNLLVVHPSVSATSVKELIALARANPGLLHYGSAGAGGNTHLPGELLRLRANIDIVHVPYRGTAPAMTALLSGEVQMMFSTLPPALVQVRAAKLRALAVTSVRRFAALADIPTIAESGLAGYDAIGSWGLLVPAKTPPRIVTLLNAAVVQVLHSDQTRAQLIKEGIEAVGNTPEQYRAHIKAEQERWAPVIKAAGIRGD